MPSWSGSSTVICTATDPASRRPRSPTKRSPDDTAGRSRTRIPGRTRRSKRPTISTPCKASPFSCTSLHHAGRRSRSGAHGQVVRRRRAGLGLVVTPDGRLAFKLSDTGAEVETIETDVPLVAGVWYSVTFTFDGADHTARLGAARAPGFVQLAPRVTAIRRARSTLRPKRISPPASPRTEGIPLTLGGVDPDQARLRPGGGHRVLQREDRSPSVGGAGSLDGRSRRHGPQPDPDT